MDLTLSYRALASGQVDLIAGDATAGLIKGARSRAARRQPALLPAVRRRARSRAPRRCCAIRRCAPRSSGLSGRVSAADMRAMNYAADVEHRDVPASSANSSPGSRRRNRRADRHDDAPLARRERDRPQIAERLGCTITRRGCLQVDRHVRAVEPDPGRKRLKKPASGPAAAAISGEAIRNPSTGVEGRSGCRSITTPTGIAGRNGNCLSRTRTSNRLPGAAVISSGPTALSCGSRSAIT